MGPSRGTLLEADPVGMAIRNLKAEAEGLPRAELPRRSVHVPEPSVLLSRRKTADEYDKDMRRAHFLERAEEAGLRTDATENQIRQLRSPYTYGPDSPLANAGRWFSSMPGAIYAGGQMLSNAIDPVVEPSSGKTTVPYPEAYDDFRKNVNNFVIFAEPMGKNLNHMRDMQDMNHALYSLPVEHDLYDAAARRRAARELPNVRPEELPTIRDMIREAYSAQAEPKIGSEYLREAGAEGILGQAGTSALGGVMDATLDPSIFFGRAKTMGQFLMDYGLGTMHETIPAAVKAKEYFRPSDAMYY